MTSSELPASDSVGIPEAAGRFRSGASTYAGVATLCLLALILRLPGLTEPLWYDELWSTRVMLGSMGDLLRAVFVDIHPPLYRFLSFAWLRVFGDSELSVRALPLLAGLATVALMPALGAVLATRGAGWFAGLLLAMSPVHIWYSQEARSYSLIILLGVLLVLQWHRLDEGPSRRRSQFWLVIISLALAQLHYYAIALPAALVAAAVLQRRNRGVALLALVLSGFSIAALLAVKSAGGVLTLESGYLRVFDGEAIAYLFGEWFALGGSVTLTSEETPIARVVGWCLLTIASAAFLAWLAVGWRFLRRDRWLEHAMMIMAVPGLLFVLALMGRDNYYIERSALPSLPFYFLAVGAGFWLIRNDFMRRGAAAVTVLASTAVLGHYYTRGDTWTVYKPNADWRAIVTPLLEERGTLSRPLVVFSTTPLTELVYYVPGADECPWPVPAASNKGLRVPGVRGTLARAFPRGERLTCGPDGTASVRLYVVLDSGSAWIDAIRSYEPGARAIVIVNKLWGITDAVVRSLNAAGHSARSIARSRGLEVFVID